MKSWNMDMYMRVITTTKETNIPPKGGMLVYTGCVVSASFLTLVLAQRS